MKLYAARRDNDGIHRQHLNLQLNSEPRHLPCLHSHPLPGGRIADERGLKVWIRQCLESCSEQR